MAELCKVYELPDAGRDRTASAVRCLRESADLVIIDGHIVPICEQHREGFELWFDEWLYAAPLMSDD